MIATIHYSLSLLTYTGTCHRCTCVAFSMTNTLTEAHLLTLFIPYFWGLTSIYSEKSCPHSHQYKRKRFWHECVHSPSLVFQCLCMEILQSITSLLWEEISRHGPRWPSSLLAHTSLLTNCQSGYLFQRYNVVRYVHISTSTMWL